MPANTDSASALIHAALPIFGMRGLEGASTRDIARAAGKPMSAITYHFGGKDGLYLACAQHIGDTIGGWMGPTLAAEGDALPQDIATARSQIEAVFAIMAHAMVRNETAEFARFIVREQQEPTEAFDVFYNGMMGQVLNRLVSLMKVVAAGRVAEIDIKVRVIAMMGQVLSFRIARAATLRLTGWHEVGEPESAVISRVIRTHLTAILNDLEQGKTP